MVSPNLFTNEGIRNGKNISFSGDRLSCIHLKNGNEMPSKKKPFILKHFSLGSIICFQSQYCLEYSYSTYLFAYIFLAKYEDTYFAHSKT